MAADRRGRPSSSTWVQWTSLAAAAVVLVVFLLAQGRDTVDVSYGRGSIAESVGDTPAETETVALPSLSELEALVRDRDVVRLPGAIAGWDTQTVEQAIGDDLIRILVAPPGLTREQQQTLSGVQLPESVRDAAEVADEVAVVITVTGTQTSARRVGQAAPYTLNSWRGDFLSGDVTSQILSVIAAARDEPSPEDLDPLAWREPSPAELAPVLTDLREQRWYAAPGTTLHRENEAVTLPSALDVAFPDEDALLVVLPRQPVGRPIPQYGPALHREFPDTPIVVMYGWWMEYHGPRGAEFADVVAASYYGQYGTVIEPRNLRQRGVLNVYLGRVADVRYSGIFERPLPYRPPDPLRMALPALPWVFGGCVLVFLGLSVRSVLLPPSIRRSTGAPARLTGLTALSIELSGLTRDAGSAALTRAVGRLGAAGSAIGDNLPDATIRSFLDEAERELTTAADALGRRDYRPDRYLQGRLE